MQPGPEKSQSFVKVFLVPISTISSPLLNGLDEPLPDQSGTGLDVAVLGGDVGFHSGAFVDGELLAYIDGAAETRIVFTGIFVVGVIL